MFSLASKIRCSRPEVFCEKSVLKNFTNFAGKHPCQSLFFNEVTSLRPGTLLRKRLRHRCFPVNFAKFLRTPFITEQLQWLLLFSLYHKINPVKLHANFMQKSLLTKIKSLQCLTSIKTSTSLSTNQKYCGGRKYPLKS